MYIGFFIRYRAMQRGFRTVGRAVASPTWEAAHMEREDQVDIWLLVSVELRAVVPVVMVMASVPSWSKMQWRWHCVLELKLSDPARYLTGRLFATSTPSLYCSGSIAFGFFRRPVQAQRIVGRKRTRDLCLGCV
jgi:hypothetical protein